VSVFYWVDRDFGYALSGELPKTELLRVAEVVYKQLNP
jgi:anti-sigma factor RsiW